MPPIPEISPEDVRPLIEECVHPARSILQADLYALTWQGKPAVLKDFSRRPWWVRRFYVPTILGREFRALRRLQGEPGIPALYAVVGRCAVLMQRLDARRLPRDKEAPPTPHFFERTRELMERLHRRGIAHGDLRRKNILIDDDENPYLIDFATAVTAKSRGWEGPASRFFFRHVARIDRIKMARIKQEFYPDALSDEERDWIASPPWSWRIGRFFKRRVLRLRKPRHRRRLAQRIRRKLGWK